jgi:hypothetical protein
MNTDPHADVYVEPFLQPLAEPADLTRDVESGPHRAVHVVLVGFRVTKHHQ